MSEKRRVQVLFCSFTEVKKTEHAFNLFIRFVLSKAVITHGLELMLSFLTIIQGIMNSIMDTAGFDKITKTKLPEEIVTAVEETGFFESIPIWAVTLIGELVIWVRCRFPPLPESLCRMSERAS